MIIKYILNLVLIYIVFQKMDKNKDGVVTLEEFIMACQEVCVEFPLSICNNGQMHAYKHRVDK